VNDTPTTRTLTTGVWNIERFGWDRDGRGHHRLGAAVEYILDQTPIPPDILALPEATQCTIDDERPLREEFLTPLARCLRGGWYEPLFSKQPGHGHRNHHYLILVNTATVHPLGWREPGDRAHHIDGRVRAEIFGHDCVLWCKHWRGGQGRDEFDKQANEAAGYGGPNRKTWMAGDFNADSSWHAEEHHSWGVDWETVCEQRGEMDKVEQKGWLNPATGRYEIDTRQIDKLRDLFGFRDAGEEWGDATPTTAHPVDGRGLRIDRVFVSEGWPGQLVDYRVSHCSRRLSDHDYVQATYRMPVAPGHDEITPGLLAEVAALGH
jgi:hypothetical protein